MRRFLLGLLIPFLAAVAYAVWTHGRYSALRAREWAALTLLLIVTPLLSGYISLRIAHWRRPRQCLTKNAARSRSAMVLGFAAGAVSLPLIGAAIMYLNQPAPEVWEDQSDSWLIPFLEKPRLWPGWSDAQRVPDSFVVMACTFLSALLAASLLPARRPGLCVRCGYDIRFSLDAGRCPECGRSLGSE